MMENYDEKNESSLYATLKLLLQHFSKDTEETASYICNSCEEKFLVKSRLRRHILKCQRDHLLPISRKRRECDDREQNIHRNAEKADHYICDLCKRKFSFRSCLVRHLRNERCRKSRSRVGLKVRCPKCDRTFPQKASLQKHLNSNSCSTSCKICGYIPRKPCELKRHMVKHTGVRIFCPHCHRKFCRAYMFRKHLLEHNVQFYQCTECYNKFIYLDELKYHQTTVHSAGKESKSKARRSRTATKLFCEYCKVNFEIEESFEDHMRDHSAPTSKEKVLRSCKFCGEEFSVKFWLQNHETECRSSVSSTSYRTSNFTCIICNLNFTNAAEFQYHKSTHTNEELKPFGCVYCNKRFALRKSLIRHLKNCPF